MIAAFNADNGAGYRRYFATSMNTNFSPAVLGSRDAVVQVNGALCIVRIHQFEIAPSLDLMLSSANSAVRYQGIKGYAAIKEAVLNQYAEPRERMMASLLAVGDKETSPVVLGALFDALDFSAITSAPEPVVRQIRSRARLGVTNCLRRCLPAIRKGDTLMAQAATRGVRTILAAGGDITNQEKTDLLQVLADLMKNAAQTYQDCSAAAASGADSPRDSIELMIQEYGNLLKDLERTAAQYTGRTEATVNEALSQKTVAAEKVMLTVNEWVGTEGSAGRITGITTPKVLPGGPAVSTTPVAQPVRTPATAPAAPPGAAPSGAAAAATPVTGAPASGAAAATTRSSVAPAATPAAAPHP